MIENNGDEGDCTVSRIRCGSANEHPERRIKLHAESRGYSAVIAFKQRSRRADVDRPASKDAKILRRAFTRA